MALRTAMAERRGLLLSHAFGSLGDEQAECSLTVVLPAYNEQNRILVTLRDTVAYLERRCKNDPYVCVVAKRWTNEMEE